MGEASHGARSSDGEGRVGVKPGGGETGAQVARDEREGTAPTGKVQTFSFPVGDVGGDAFITSAFFPLLLMSVSTERCARTARGKATFCGEPADGGLPSFGAVTPPWRANGVTMGVASPKPGACCVVARRAAGPGEAAHAAGRPAGVAAAQGLQTAGVNECAGEPG
mmetsp:Transcript_39632/g.114668  ORF Transcript_39632/g.114668 Transcript_39632/m.114668 type:complete len:166 (+) Transcript_39632:157-654(+)